MSLITVTAPGDLVGAITAIANTITSIANATTALAQDQSPEGRAAAKNLIEFLAPFNFIIQKLNRKLKIDPLDEPAPQTTVTVETK